MPRNGNVVSRLSLWLMPLALVVSTACEPPGGTDSTAPQLSITAPADGSTTADRTPTVTLTYSDEAGGSGVDTGSLSVSVDGKQTDFTCDATATGATCTPDEDLPSGMRTITASISDEAGNEATDTSTFTLTDALPPMVMLVEPADMVASTQSPTLRITYNDGNGSGVDTSSLSVMLDGTDITGDCDVQAAEATCTTTGLAAGMHTVDVSVADNAGNVQDMSFMFSVVLSVSLTIDTPEDELLTRADTIDLSGTVGANAASLSVNNRSVPISGGGFLTTVTLHEGVNDITAIAQGASGATGAASVRVIRDTEAPRVLIDGPMNGSVVAASRVTITGTVQDTVIGPVNNANCTVRVGGRTGFATADIENGTFVVEDFELVQGANTIMAIATDAIGNESAPIQIVVNRANFAGQRLAVVSGGNQRGSAGMELPQPVVVRASDVNDNPLSNRIVSFTVSRNNGTIDDSGMQTRSVRTDSNGEASIRWTLGSRAGRANNRLSIVAPGFVANTMAGAPLPLVVCASGMAGGCDMLVSDGGDNQAGVSGQPLARPFIVTALDADGNRCANQTVTFAVTAGSGRFRNGETTIEKTTNAGGFATATLTLGMTAGINNNVVQVSTPGGGGNVVSFQASAFAPTADGDTTFSGIVMNTSNEPLEGVHVSIHDADPPVETMTDASGQFLLTGVPLGNQLIEADGTVIGMEAMEGAKGLPVLENEYPAIELVVDIIPGVENTLGRAMHLPALDPNAVGTVNAFSDSTFSMAGVEGFELKVFAGSATFPDGSTDGQMSVTQVRSDQVPMPPNGGAAPPWVGTFQPPGVHFDPPVQLTVPNSLGLEPGRVVDMFSFNHELAMYINVGTGTVRPDGMTIVSDPGSGITVSGWFFDCPPPPPPVQIMNTDDLLTDKGIQQGFQDALDDSNPGVMPLGVDGEHEEGGWLIQGEDGSTRVQRWPVGDGDSITPNDPVLNEGETVVGSFHTHPENPDFEESPSDADVTSTQTTVEDFGLDADRFLGCFVVSCNQIWRVDPDGNVGQVSMTGPNPGD